MLPGFRMREVRRLRDSGHQTAILTTRHDLSLAVVAYRMFERWTQENFVRYMRQPFALNALVTYAVELAHPPNAQSEPRAQGTAKATDRGAGDPQGAGTSIGARGPDESQGRRPTVRGFTIAHGTLGQQIRAQEHACRALETRIAVLPERVPVKAVMAEGEIVKLAPGGSTARRRPWCGASPRTTPRPRARASFSSATCCRRVPTFVPEAQRLRICLHS
jgi:hypothetical protein